VVVSAPSPRGRGLQGSHPTRWDAASNVSAPSPRGRGLQEMQEEFSLSDERGFQRHRPGEGDCKRMIPATMIKAATSFSAIAPGKGTASCRHRSIVIQSGLVSAPSPRGRGLQAHFYSRKDIPTMGVSAPSPRGRGLQEFLSNGPHIPPHVSAPSPRGRGLQVPVRERFLPVITEFQRHRPGEGDCKIR